MGSFFHAMLGLPPLILNEQSSKSLLFSHILCLLIIKRFQAQIPLFLFQVLLFPQIVIDTGGGERVLGVNMSARCGRTWENLNLSTVSPNLSKFKFWLGCYVIRILFQTTEQRYVIRTEGELEICFLRTWAIKKSLLSYVPSHSLKQKISHRCFVQSSAQWKKACVVNT